jgi:glycosyltransferase involved in cell wall biosynthesis
MAWSSEAGSFADELETLKVESFPVNMTRQLAVKPIYQLRDIIRHNEIVLVHSQGARADFFARIAARIADAPHILCTVAMPVQGFDVSPLRKKIYRLLDQLTERYVKRFIVVSGALERALVQERGIPAHRVVRIYNGIEVKEYRPTQMKTGLRDQWGVARSVPLIGAIGRMVWQKGFKYLIQSVPNMLEVIPEARFLLVGDGPLRADLEGLVRELNIHDRVIFTGFRSDILEILSTIDILVAPSLLEGFPMITLEAMAMAKPIVATQIEGIIEQISEGEEGMLVPPKNPNALAAEVLRLVQDKELSSRLGAAARRKVESCFSVEKMIKETEKVYISHLKVNSDE